MTRLSWKISPVALLLLCVPVIISPAAEKRLAYQGTHILTYSTMGRLAEAYRKLTGVTVDIMGGGCSDGAVAISKDRTEMGGVCCPMLPEEEDRGFVAHPVARDIKVAIVNFINPIAGLSSQQLRDIHQGKVTNWQELGWIDRPIAVIYRKHCLDRREPVRVFLGLDDQLDNLAAKAIVVRTDMQLIDYVSRFPTAIGITSDVFVTTRKEDINRLRLDKIEPTAANVQSGRYPFTAEMFIVTKGKPDPFVRKFLDFVLSESGQNIVRENLAGAP